MKSSRFRAALTHAVAAIAVAAECGIEDVYVSGVKFLENVDTGEPYIRVTGAGLVRRLPVPLVHYECFADQTKVSSLYRYTQETVRETVPA